MHIINVNGTISYKRCQQAQARIQIAAMSEEERQHTLDSIKLQQGVSNLKGQQYNTEMLNYIEKLLTGETEHATNR